jgi:hypothetical protein
MSRVWVGAGPVTRPDPSQGRVQQRETLLYHNTETYVYDVCVFQMWPEPNSQMWPEPNRVWLASYKVRRLHR